jgi:hypothetical protein
MKHEETKMILSAAAAQAVVNAQPAAVDALLGKAIPNVIGIGAGIKWKNGVPTGDPALVVLVTHKVAKDDLDKASLIPAKLQNLATDVLAVGHLFALDEDPILEEDEDPILEEDEDPILEEDEDPILEEDEDPILEEDEDPILEEARRKRKALKRKLRRLAVKARKYRVRPIVGGISVSHRNVTAGTIGACVYDFLPDGVGKPNRYYILSNNHVLANSNAAHIGDTILQPGRADGGLIPRDRIGRLSRFIPIQFAPDVALAAQHNLVDAALAAVPFHLLNGGIKWIGDVRGWRQKSAVTVGTMVKKVGRTTNLTTGRIIVVNATVDVNYRNGKVARFKEQFLTTNMSAGGDSGSLITTLDNVAVGLLFAGSSQVTVANQIENVRSLLRVEIA